MLIRNAREIRDYTLNIEQLREILAEEKELQVIINGEYYYLVSEPERERMNEEIKFSTERTVSYEILH